MYIASVALLMFIFPVVSIIVELLVSHDPSLLIDLIGKWFVFWAIGVRLLSAGVRQAIKPGLTSEGIFGIKGKEVWALVREVGFANVSLGLAGIISLWQPGWRVPVALIGGLYLLLAGLIHIRSKHRNFEENIAMYSDLSIGIVTLVFVITVSFS